MNWLDPELWKEPAQLFGYWKEIVGGVALAWGFLNGGSRQFGGSYQRFGRGKNIRSSRAHFGLCSTNAKHYGAWQRRAIIRQLPFTAVGTSPMCPNETSCFCVRDWKITKRAIRSLLQPKPTPPT